MWQGTLDMPPWHASNTKFIPIIVLPAAVLCCKHVRVYAHTYARTSKHGHNGRLNIEHVALPLPLAFRASAFRARIEQNLFLRVYC